jgi:hypothetical protein
MKSLISCAAAFAALVVVTGQLATLPWEGVTRPQNPSAILGSDVTPTADPNMAGHTVSPGSAAMSMPPAGPTALPPAGPAMPMPSSGTSSHPPVALGSTPMPPGGNTPPGAQPSADAPMPMPPSGGTSTQPPVGAVTPMPMPSSPTSTPPAGGVATPTAMPMPSATAAPGASATPVRTATPMPMPTGTGTPATPAPIVSGGGCSVVPNGQANPSDEPEPMGPVWCFPMVSGPTTRTIDASGGWTDTFATNVQMMHLNDGELGYRVFNTFGGNMRAATWINNNHWMVDLVDQSAFRLSGGTLLSPNRSFQFVNGKLVVEVDAAAGQDGVGGANVFYEVDITPAAAPTGTTVDPLYGYGQFGGIGAVGCRLERQTDGGHTVCAMYDNTTHDTGGTDVGPLCNQPPNFDRSQCRNGGPGRVWETQGLGNARTAPTIEGGYPGYAIPGTTLHGRDVFRTCLNNQMDIFCRDRFRFELTKTSLTIFVNGYKWFDVQGLYASNPLTGADNRIPDSWFGPNGVRVYLTTWINGGQHTPVRLHWGRIAVNPTGGLTASPMYCLGDPQNTCPMH